MIIDQRTNLIKFQYNTVAAAYTGGGSATIGIKSTTSLGNQYSFNSAGSVSANSAILFHNESISDYSASLAPEDVSISDFVPFTYTINSIDPGGAQGLGKLDRISIGNPFSTTPTITSVTIDGQSAFIQLSTSKPTDPDIATWFYKESGPSDSLIVQTSLFSVGQTVVITYLQGIPSVPVGDYTFASTVDATLYPTNPLTASPQPDVSVSSSGAVDYILIRDESDGDGIEFGLHTMSTDESLTLYAAGYDAGHNFVGDQDVTWTLTGTLDGGGGTGTNFIFNPSAAPTSGTIAADLISIGATDATETITVTVGNLNTLDPNRSE